MKKTFFLVALLSASVAAMADAPTTKATAPTLPAAQVKSLYSDVYAFAPPTLNSYNENWWNPPTLEEVTIDGSKMLHYTIAQDGMIGWQFDQIVLSSMEKVHIDLWSSVNGQAIFTPISRDNGKNEEYTITFTANQWNSFDIDLTVFTNVDLTRVFQVEFLHPTAPSELWIDNLFFYRTTPDTDNEAPTNVTAALKSVSYVGAVLTVSAEDNSGTVAYDVLNGTTKVGTGGGASGASIDIAVSGLAANSSYTLSVIASDGNNNQADPVLVTVNTLALPAAAPAPTALAADVLSLYSDAYTPAATFAIGWWSQTTVATEVNLAANDKAYLCTNSNYLGWEINGNVAAFDVTGFKGVHMDLYPVEGTSIQFTPIWGSELLVTKSLTAGQWNQVDFLLSEFTGLNPANIYQVKWAEMPSTVLIDNVYFFKENTTGISEVESAAKVQKVIENGQLIIIKNGVRYDAMGAVIR